MTKPKKVHLNIATQLEHTPVPLCDTAGEDLTISSTFAEVTCEKCLRDQTFPTRSISALVGVLIERQAAMMGAITRVRREGN